MSLYKKIEETISGFNTDIISTERKALLDTLVDTIQNRVDNNESIRLNFICTHNSRRSHFSQVWAQVLAFHFGIKDVYSYSSGTEATAVFPMIIETLNNTGFEVSKLADIQNPLYSIKYDRNEASILAFSKRMDDAYNPSTDFIAVMTCSDADEGCPIVQGASSRIPVTFEDPKAFDGTDLQKAKYAERSIQIATDLFYVFSNVRTK